MNHSERDKRTERTMKEYDYWWW